MLDKLPAWARHLAVVLVGALLTWAGTDLVPALQNAGGVAAIAASVVTMAIMYLTPLTKQYGVGS